MRAQADLVSCPLPIADIHHQHLRTLRAQGREAWDWTSVAHVLAEETGIVLGQAGQGSQGGQAGQGDQAGQGSQAGQGGQAGPTADST